MTMKNAPAPGHSIKENCLDLFGLDIAFESFDQLSIKLVLSWAKRFRFASVENSTYRWACPRYPLSKSEDVRSKFRVRVMRGNN